MPDGHTFKAFPMQVIGDDDYGLIFDKMVKEKHCLDIMGVDGVDVCFGVKSRVVVMADDVMAVWVIVAVRFKSRVGG